MSTPNINDGRIVPLVTKETNARQRLVREGLRASLGSVGWAYNDDDVVPLDQAIYLISISGGGTVSLINTIGPITGGPIDTNGTISLDLTADIQWDGQHVFAVTLPTSVLVPTDADEFTNKAYVDQLVAGLAVQDAATVATAAALPACTAAGAGVGKTLTMDAIGILTVDGIATVLNDVILVKNQVAQKDNGCYVVTTEGTAGVAAVLTRRSNYDQTAEVVFGSFFGVEQGTQAGLVFIQTRANPITVDTTPIVFSFFFTGTSYTANQGVRLTGTIFSANLAVNQGLRLIGNTLATDYDNITLGIVANKLAFKGNSTHVLNASGVAGATVTAALDALNAKTALVSITVAAAQALVTGNTVVVGQWYNITDSSQAVNAADRILVRGTAINKFDQTAVYVDTVNNQRNEIQYILDDVPTDLIIYRRDNNGNEFWDQSGALILACPIWGNVSWTNNKFYGTTFTGVLGNSAVTDCIFNKSCTLALGAVNNLGLRNVELLRGTTMVFDQDDLFAISCVFGAATFTWAATAYFDLVAHSRIVSVGVITTGTYGITTQIGYSNIEHSGDIDFSVLTNNSLYYITTKQGSNNLTADLDMSDVHIFSAGSLAPQFNIGFVERFRMINNSGATITTMTIANGNGIKLWAESGSTYTFTHVAIGAATAGQLVRTGGAGNSVLVGYATASDIVEYYAPVEGNANPTQTLFIKLT
jgi:hypothetical protein